MSSHYVKPANNKLDECLVCMKGKFGSMCQLRSQQSRLNQAGGCVADEILSASPGAAEATPAKTKEYA